MQTKYEYCQAFDKDYKQIKEFKSKGVGDRHFGNFIDACISRDDSKLNADAMTGHLSAGVSHLGNISYYLGENNLVTVDELKTAVDGIKSLDNNAATLEGTVSHLESNGVDLKNTPIALGPHLKFDAKTERFTNNDDANKMLTREYRQGFEVPSGDKV